MILDDWAAQIMNGAFVFAGLRGCTPGIKPMGKTLPLSETSTNPFTLLFVGYYNREGEMDMITDPAMQAKAMKNAVWPYGFTSFCDTLEKWRAEGDIKGLDITYV
jgi:hypothetical protein